jgi:hypothetical protein
MQTKVQLIYNDVCTLCVLALVIFNGTNTGLNFFWICMFIYFMGRQIIAHRSNYKLNHRLF